MGALIVRQGVGRKALQHGIAARRGSTAWPQGVAGQGFGCKVPRCWPQGAKALAARCQVSVAAPRRPKTLAAVVTERLDAVGRGERGEAACVDEHRAVGQLDHLVLVGVLVAPAEAGGRAKPPRL